MVDLAGLPPPQGGVEGDSLVPAFREPSVQIEGKSFAISQTTRCHLDNAGMLVAIYLFIIQHRSI
jgi:hypothetical protein|eukprot:COSAG06_NODE_6885_length_2729_cov_14.615970_1_plen_65_part_00